MFILTGYFGNDYVAVMWDRKTGSKCEGGGAEAALKAYRDEMALNDGSFMGFPPANGSETNYDRNQGAALALWSQVLGDVSVVDGPGWATGDAVS